MVQNAFPQIQLKYELSTIPQCSSAEKMLLAASASEYATMRSGYSRFVEMKNQVLENRNSDHSVVMAKNEVSKYMKDLKDVDTLAQVALAIISLMVAIVVFIANRN